MKKLLTASTFTAKVAIVVAATLGGTALVSSSVFASLTATASNTSGGSVTTGTLKLTQAASSVSGITGGFTTAITSMAPGDTQNRYIDLNNGGTLDASALTLGISATPANALTTDGTNGLQVTVNQCSVPWTSAGACTGTTTAGVMASSSALSLASAKNVALAAGSYLAAAINHLQIVISLPAGSEVTNNGTLPSGTVQGLTTSITWTFTEAQRASTATNA